MHIAATGGKLMPLMELLIDRTTTDGALVISVDGELDVYTAPRLHDALIEASAQGHRVMVVDLSRVEFIDSSGLGVLVGSKKQLAAEAGRLSLVITSPNLAKIFRITGFDDVFDIYPSVAAAISQARESSE